MNVISLVGNLANDCYINGGKATRFKIVTKIGYDNEKKEDRIAYVPITAFGLSKAQQSLLTKGRLVSIIGHVEENRYEKNNETIWETTVKVQKNGINFPHDKKEEKEANNGHEH